MPIASSGTFSAPIRIPRSTWPRSIRTSRAPTSWQPGLSRKTTIKTYWGDARQFVELNQDKKEYDLIFGDAFNDFSVPWHLTTLEFNQKLKKMMSPSGVYMINIIDAYESDARANEKAEDQIQEERVTDDTKKKKIHEQAMAKAYRFGGFVGAWVRTAKKTFDHVYIFGTDAVPGEGSRETFVVVVSNQALDLADLGKRPTTPSFLSGGRPPHPSRTHPTTKRPSTSARVILFSPMITRRLKTCWRRLPRRAEKTEMDAGTGPDSGDAGVSGPGYESGSTPEATRSRVLLYVALGFVLFWFTYVTVFGPKAARCPARRFGNEPARRI